MRIQILLGIALSSACFACTTTVQTGTGSTVSTQELQAAPTSPPTATFTVTPLGQANPTNTLTVDIADQVVFTWAATGATQAQSWYTVDSPDTCTNEDSTGPFPWGATTLNGTATQQFMTCQQGHTYTYSYVVQDSADGQSTVATVVIKVNLNGT